MPTYISPERVTVDRYVRAGGRKPANGKGKEAAPTFRIRVPSEIAEQLPAALQFHAELTDEGLLFRPVTSGAVALPSWAKNGTHA